MSMFLTAMYCIVLYYIDVLYSASADYGASQPKHVVKIKTCVVFARK
jgi:hypothetical protein